MVEDKTQHSSGRNSDFDDELSKLSREVVVLLQNQKKRDKKGEVKEKKRGKQALPVAFNATASPVATQLLEEEKSGSVNSSFAVGEHVKKWDKDKQAYYEMSEKRRVTITKFRGRARVDIREFYHGHQDGTLLPGKKGISMSHDEYLKFKSMIPAIDEEIVRLQKRKKTEPGDD